MMIEAQKKIIGLGAGVQSSFMVLGMTDNYRIDKIYKKLKGAIPIFSDTGSEKPETMEYWKKVIEPELKAVI